MRIYYCEDRSAGNTGAAASPVTCDIIQLYELTDWSVHDMETIIAMKEGEEIISTDSIYVRREPDSEHRPDNIQSQLINGVQHGP